MIEYKNQVWQIQLLLDRKVYAGSVIPKSLMPSLIAGLVAVLLVIICDHNPGLREDVHLNNLKASQLWVILTGTLVFLIGFRTNKAYGRFWDGTTLLHQMWGEWFDAVSCLVAFSSIAKKSKPAEVAEFRHTVIRLMSLCHSSALEEISFSDLEDFPPTSYPCLDAGGLDKRTLQYLNDCRQKSHDFNRVEVLLHMIQTLIVDKHQSGVLQIPPPILSRVFQTLSRGQVNLSNCKKIVTTQFPFPYAQAIALLLLVLTAYTPLMMAALLEVKQWAFIFSSVSVFGLWALNFVAQQLEIPFGSDPNDLPLMDFQDHMNKSMLMLVNDQTDHVASINSSCALDHAAILAKTYPADMVELLELAEQETPEITNVVIAIEKQPDPPSLKVVEKPPEPVLKEVSKEVRKDLALDQALQKRIEDLGKTLEELMTTSSGLCSQLGQSSESFKEFTASACNLSRQLEESTGRMLESKLDLREPGKRLAAQPPWNIPLPAPEVSEHQPPPLLSCCRNGASQANIHRIPR